MIDIAQFLSALALKRPVFHSEADFQHAFAWQLHEKFPNAQIRLEYAAMVNQRIYLDLWMKTNKSVMAIELKYKTSLLDIEDNGETYHLKNQSAQDIGRCAFLEDVYRLEQVTQKVPNTTGLAIILTNDSSYWSPSRKINPVDADFRLHEGREISGLLSWSDEASPGTKRGHSEPLNIAGKYLATWKDYSDVSNDSKGKFRYLAFEINNQT